MRPTKVARNDPDKSPVVVYRTPDQQSTSPLPTAAYSSATVSEPKESQPCSEQEGTTPIDSSGESLSINRPRREIRLRIRFKDYVCKYTLINRTVLIRNVIF